MVTEAANVTQPESGSGQDSKTINAAVLPPRPWGVYTWLGGGKDRVPSNLPVKGFPLVLSWSKLEPQPGKFAFDQQVRVPLERARNQGQCVFLMVWVAPNKSTPQWLYDLGVPQVKVPERTSPVRKRSSPIFPYYFHPIYREHFYGAIQALGDYVAALPPDLKERIVFVQSAEGSTGDGQPYKGKPLNPSYAISKEQWSQFRQDTWAVFLKAFQRADGSLRLPLAANGDANGPAQNAWLLEHCNVFGIKQGMFSHGYLVSDSVERLANWNQFRAEASARGKSIFSRGEEDGEWKVCGWCSQNPPRALYWSALFALHCKLDMWNLPVDALTSQPIGDAVRIFNRYAGYDEAEDIPAAFCALRRGLDAADTNAFPESKFGAAAKNNLARYLAIAKAFAPLGARQGDPEKALGGGMINRQADDQNDVGWGILRGNFERFLTQIKPDETSIGLWNMGRPAIPTDCSRAGSMTRSGRTEMRFRIADAFFQNPAEQHAVRVRVIYLDQGQGQWALTYASPQGEKDARMVSLTNSGEWREINVTLLDAVWNHRLADGADLALRQVGSGDTTFHLIELEKQ